MLGPLQRFIALGLLAAVSCSGPDRPANDADVDAGGDADADADADGPYDADVVGEPTILDAGDSATLVVEARGEVRLERGEVGETLLRLPLDAFEIGTVNAIQSTLNYDPYYLEDVDQAIYRPPAGLAWHQPVAAEVERSAEGAVITLEYEGGRTGSVSAVVGGEGRFELTWTLPVGEPPVAFARLRLRASVDDHYYGLGEFFDHVDHRGLIRAMQLEPLPLESANNEAHVPIPLLIGTSGWGLFVDSLRPGVFAVANEEDDLVKVTYGLGSAASEGLRVALIAEDHPLDVTRHYYELTGALGPVAPWALGPVIWRNEIDGQTAVEDDLRTIRDLDLATTAYWIDRPYATAVNSFDFDPARYDDPPVMMSLASDLGLPMALWHTPYVDPDDDASRPLYDHALANDFFPPDRGTAIVRWGPPIDFTNPAAYSWWQELLESYRALGISGYKLDYAEEVIVGAFGIRTPWLFHDGTDELTMHRGYELLYHQVYAEMLPEAGGFLLCRAAVTGDQVHGPIIWPGDIDANLARQGDVVDTGDGESYTAVGGLPAAVVASSTLGPSGFPLFGSDTGGYRHSPPDRETYIRWFQHTALSTVMQVGTGSDDVPWDLGEIGLDDEVLDLYRTFARLHLRLFPYLWTYLERVRTDGRAIQRPLGLAHPELGAHPDDVYLLGDDLLVAPVVDPGVTERVVPLPEGRWQGWWDGALYEGGGQVTVPAPLETIPFLVRLWAPVPMLRPTIDAIEPVADTDAIDSFATAAGPLWVRVGVDPDATGTGDFVLYDGTTLTVSSEAGTSGCVDTSLGRAAGSVFDDAVVFEVVGGSVTEATYVVASTGSAVPLDEAVDQTAFDEAVAAWYEPESGWALVKLPDDGATAELTVCQ